jgi:uncharacterized membrane protein YkoI
MRCSGSGVDNRGVIPFSRLPSTCSGPRGRAALHALLAAGLATLLLVPVATATDQRDHERARAAVQAGEVLPLPTLLERLQRTHPGQVLELELEREDGRWIYEVKLLQAGGQLLKLEVDAATGQVLQARRKKSDKPRPAEDRSR